MKDLLDIRKDIDKIDEQIVKLYEERMKLTSDVAECRKKRKVILPDTESVNFLSRSWQ